MHRSLILLLLPACAACASRSPEPGDPDEIRSLVRLLRGAPSEGTPPDERPEARLAALGEPALPALKEAVSDPGDSRYRERAARALALMWNSKGIPGALETYLLAVRSAPNDPHARSLLSQAFRFHDSEGRVLALLDAALQELRVVTPELVTAAGAMTDVEATETMMKVIAKTKDADVSPERDLAFRYLGRSARRGRRESVAFLTMCTQSGNADMMVKAGVELKLIAGRDSPKGWREWWLEHASGERKSWLVAAFPSVGGKPFDPADRDHLGELVARIPESGDAEPELWFLEQALGRNFGYVSP